MIEIRKAKLEDTQGIIKVCSDGHRNTYPGLIPSNLVEGMISEYYNEERIIKEIKNTNQEWNGWYVAVDEGQVIGAGGGGFIGEEVAELFVIYLDPSRKREGIERRLLDAITQEQIERGAKEQWVSVAKNNMMGIPFYEAVGFEYQEEVPSYELPPEEGYRSLRYKRKLINRQSKS